MTLIFPNRPNPEPRTSPPYTLSPDHVRDVLEPRFEPVYLAPVPEALSHPGRGGLEWLGRWRRT